MCRSLLVLLALLCVGCASSDDSLPGSVDGITGDVDNVAEVYVAIEDIYEALEALEARVPVLESVEIGTEPICLVEGGATGLWYFRLDTEPGRVLLRQEGNLLDSPLEIPRAWEGECDEQTDLPVLIDTPQGLLTWAVDSSWWALR